jgi:ankyrin repeat protein
VLLLKHGANVNMKGGVYGYALQAASASGYQHVVRTLLDYGADSKAQGGKYGTALSAALSNDHWKIVEMLLDEDSDVKASMHTSIMGQLV